MKNKWILIFLIIPFMFTFSCKSKENKDDPSGEKELTEDEKIAQLLIDDDDATTFRAYYNYMDGRNYDMVEVELGDRLKKPVDPERSGYVFEGWYVDKSYSALYDFSTRFIESIMIYAKWSVYEGVDYSFILDEYVPSSTSVNLDLPTELEDYSDIYLAWKSSDPNTIDNNGNIYQGRENIKVTLTLTVYADVKSTYETDIVVEPITFVSLEARKNKAMFGYYSYWNFAGYTEDQLKLDVINASFAYVSNDLSIDMRQITPYVKNFLIARQSGVRVVLSIQAANDCTNFSLAAKTEENRKLFAKNIVDVIEKYHFDGVDIDWEYPGWDDINAKHHEAENYTLLMKEIYTAVKNANADYIVSAAIPGGAEGWQRYDLDQVQVYLDYIHMMTYDMEASTKMFHHTALYGTNGKTTGNQSSIDDSVQIFVLRGVPYEKIVPGIAFYGKMAHPSTSVNGGLGSSSADSKSYTTITYTNIYNNYISKIDGTNIIYYYDKECEAPYLYVKNGNYFITYDDETSIKAKCTYARALTKDEEYRLGGVMIWEIGEDRTGNLMKAVLSGMKRG